MNLINCAGLHLAAEYGLNSNVSALLSKGADPDLQDVTKKTPIFLATQNGNGDCIQSVRYNVMMLS